MQINTEKYNVDWEIMWKYDNLWIVQSQILKYLFIFDHIQKYLVYQYSDLTSSISDEKAFGPIRLFELFRLNFDEW